MLKSEHEGRRRLGGAGQKVIHQGRREPREVLAVDRACKPRKGGRTGHGVLWGSGAPLDSQWAPRVMAETVGVMAVRIARGHVRAALGSEVAQRMVHRGRRPLLMARCRQARREPKLSVYPSQEEGPEVRRQGPTRKIGPDSLSTDRRKTPLLWARIGHKQTSGGFYSMAVSHLPFSQRLTRGLSVFMKNSG
jgi:hypothetical protein